MKSCRSSINKGTPLTARLSHFALGVNLRSASEMMEQSSGKLSRVLLNGPASVQHLWGHIDNCVCDLYCDCVYQ